MCDYCNGTEFQSGYKFCPQCGCNLVKIRPCGGTLCWSCKNAVPNSQYGCYWSQKLQPVEGWEAVQTSLYLQNSQRAASYSVISCPQFIEDDIAEELAMSEESKEALTKRLNDISKKYFSERN